MKSTSCPGFAGQGLFYANGWSKMGRSEGQSQSEEPSAAPPPPCSELELTNCPLLVQIDGLARPSPKSQLGFFSISRRLFKYIEKLVFGVQ